MSARLFPRIIVVHQWLGALLSVPVLVWFVSGVVMTFASYPRLTEAERLNLMVPLRQGESGHCPRLGVASHHRVEMVQRGDRKLCLYTTESSSRRAQWYQDQMDYSPLMPSRVGDANPYLSNADYMGLLVEPDQWTFSSRLRSYFPLYKFSIDDNVGTEVYVSRSTTEIVHRSTRRQRWVAWFGAIPHWIYPTILRRHGVFWRWLVILLSFTALLGTLSGLALGGLLQYRTWKRSGRWYSPFKKSLYRVHHYLGFGFGVVTATWLLSGALSLNPFGWSPGAAPTQLQHRLLAGVMPTPFVVSATEAIRICEKITPRKLQWMYLGNAPYYLCLGKDGRSLVVDGTTGFAQSYFPEAELLRAFVEGFTTTKAAQADWLTEPDALYYPAHGHSERVRYPYLRIQLDEPGTPSVYIDARYGELALWHTQRSRWERWLYHGLHSLDFPWLYRIYPLWHTVVLVLLGGGIVLSYTGVRLSQVFLIRMYRRWK